MSQSMTVMYPEPELSKDAFHDFQAEIERLAQDADAILASSWGDVKPGTTSTSSIEEPLKTHTLDDDWSSEDEESVVAADDTLAKELQLLETLMSEDPTALSEQISKMLHDGTEEQVPLHKKDEPQPFIQSKSTTTPEEATAPGPSTSTPQREAAVSQAMSQELLQFAKGSRDVGIDGALLVGDGLRLMNEDPTALSEQISKMLHDSTEEQEPLNKDEHQLHIQSQPTHNTTTHEENTAPGPSNTKQIGESGDMDDQPEGDHQVGDAECASAAVDQGMNQEMLRSAQESRDCGIDRALLVGDGLRVIDAGIHNGGAELVQFTGRIGTESRSVRTRKPLAKPQVLTHQQFQGMKQKELQTLLVRRNHHQKQVKAMKPFVDPFLDSTGKLSFLPRLVSYYEIEITKPPSHSIENSPDGVKSSSSDDKDIDHWDAPCIAIGLAGVEFPVKDTMPGWKSRSFGYHSDDGTAWANKMKKAGYAEKFGVGDVVGCGVDYRTGGTVFYTLNGKFLGHASTLDDDELEIDWYPTMGFDSHDCASCHFGLDKPFVFDLLKYCQDGPGTPTSSPMKPATDSKNTHLRRSRRFLRFLRSGFQAPKPKDLKRLSPAIGRCL